jgi:hypothetical protein
VVGPHKIALLNKISLFRYITYTLKSNSKFAYILLSGTAMSFKSSASTLVLCVAAATLSACGGGGSAGSSSSSPAQVVLASSAGDLSKYRGTWASNCGLTFIVGSSARSGTGVFQFGTATSATVIPGTVSVALYSNTSCAGTPLSSGSNPMTTTFVSSANPVATANASSSSIVFSGSADKVTIQEYNRASGALVGTARTQYAAFSSNFTELRVEGTSTFSSTDLVLKN